MLVRSMFIAMALVLAVRVVPCAGQSGANTCQREWVSGFGLSGTDGTVNTMIEFDDGHGPALYVGGQFTHANGVTVNAIARWDGQQWSALGDGEVGVDGLVNALLVFDDGSGGGPSLFVGGQFTMAGGVTASSIARWNGKQWSAVGTGFDGPVNALVIWSGSNGLSPALYAGGSFSNSGGTAVRNLGKWNPLTSTWSAAGGPSAGWNGSIRTMAVFDDGTGVAPALYVGGEFTLAGGVAANNIAKRNNLGWSTLNDTSVPAINGTTGPVSSLAVYDDDGCGPHVPQLYVGGATSFSVPNYLGISRWNGTAWSLLTDPLEGWTSPFTAREFLAINDPDNPVLIAVANWTIGVVARWTGSAWSNLGSSDFNMDVEDPQINALALARTQQNPISTLFAGGIFNSAGPGGAANMAELKEGDWAPLGEDRGQGVWLWSMATFDDDSGQGPQLYAGRDYAGVVRLRESGWQVPGQGLWGNVSCLASLTVGDSGKPSLFAGGWIQVPPSASFIGIAKFDGRTWETVGEGLSGSVDAITVFDEGLGDGPALFAGGSFQPMGTGTPRYVLARWNGRQWQYVGESFSKNSGFRCMTVFDDGNGPAIYAGGYFNPSGAKSEQRVVRWNPEDSTFADVGGEMDSPGGSYSGARALAVFDDGRGPALYVAGQFTHAGGNLVNHIAQWNVNTKSWTAVGGGMTSTNCTPCLTVYTLQTFDDGGGQALYAGGYFAHAGSALAHGIAKWNGQSWSGLGSGIDGIVLSMTPLNDASSSSGTGASLYVGGAWITTAGGIASNDIAKWSCAVRCFGDVVPAGGNGVINIDDLVAVITAWGSCAGCAQDIDGNGVVDIDDLVAVITAWGPCQ